MIPNPPRHYETHQNMSLGSDGVDRVDLLQKILTRLCGTNFCINCNSLACFQPSIIKQRNGPKCTQTLRNTTKHEFWVQWGGSGAIVVKNSDASSWHESRTISRESCSARFAPSFVRQPNGPECTQIVRNAPKHEFRVQWGGSGAFVAKNSYTTSWTFALFALIQPILHRVSCSNQMVPNAPKHYETQQNMAWIGWICCKNY